MPVRDLVLTLFIFGLLPVAFARPYIGVLLFTWISLMNPHRLTWGFAFGMQFALIVAVVTLAGLVFTSDRRPLPRCRETALLASLWAFFVVSTLFAQYPDNAIDALTQVSKILLMVFVTIMLFQDRRRLRWLLLVMALSVGFYGLKGGIWALMTGGENRVWGPTHSFLADNNAIALGLNMTLPLLWFLAEQEPRVWLRRLLRIVFVMSVPAILVTYSRGGLLGLLVVLAALWWRVRPRMKVALIVLGLVYGSYLTTFLPEQWYARMRTIETYEQDPSAIGRLTAWRVGWRLAMDSPLLGAGFEAFTRENFVKYVPDYPGVHSAHSVYFQLLGEQGLTGFGLYMALMGCTFLSLNAIRRQAARRQNDTWIGNYARMVQVSLVGFAVTGIFQNHAYFDYYFLLVGITIILIRLNRDAVKVIVPAQGVAVPTTPSVRHFPRIGPVRI